MKGVAFQKEGGPFLHTGEYLQARADSVRNRYIQKRPMLHLVHMGRRVWWSVRLACLSIYLLEPSASAWSALTISSVCVLGL